MHISDNSLKGLDENLLRSLTKRDLLDVSILLLADLKETRDRLNQNPANSSKPPSSKDPWFLGSPIDIKDEKEEEEPLEELPPDEKHSDDPKKGNPENKPAPKELKKKAGKQLGAKGYGRTQQLPITETILHRVNQCENCGLELNEDTTFNPLTGHYTIDIEVGDINDSYLKVTNTKHIYGDTICPCGHKNHTIPYRCEKEAEWDVEITQWNLIGPQLISLLCCLAFRMRLSRSRIQEFLLDWLGLRLSVGVINKSIHESGRAVSPVEDQLIEEVRKSNLLKVDETSWKERGRLQWLWVFCTSTVILYTIGFRSQDVIIGILSNTYAGLLMSDGYQAYRMFSRRLRCWAHLLRKARGLEESLNEEARVFGTKTLEALNTLKQAIYKAREGPEENLLPKFEKLLDDFLACCEKFRDSEHEKTRQLAREFLNDWDAIFRVLANPHLPLTNNEAEQALRHWVIARRLSHGTRTRQGSWSFMLLASVIDTCRKRKVSPWKYIAEVVSERRQGRSAPPLPLAA